MVVVVIVVKSTWYEIGTPTIKAAVWVGLVWLGLTPLPVFKYFHTNVLFIVCYDMTTTTAVTTYHQ